MTRVALSKTIVSSLRRMASTSATPMEDVIRTKLSEALKPTHLEIRNDSHLHSHHKAMQGVTSKETHFALNIVSAAFEGQRQIARHRMVTNVLKDELQREGGIHALQLRTTVPEKDQDSKGEVKAE